MKIFLMAAMSVVVAAPASAGIGSASGGPLFVLAVQAPRTVAVALAIPADFVSVPVKIISEQKNSPLAYDESRQAIEMIYQKAKEKGQFRALTGVASLSQHRSAYGISSGSWSQPAAAADIYLLVPLTKERDNIFAAGAEAARFVEALRLPGKSRCELGRLQLAVENPEQYRGRLLGLIAQEIKKAREALSGSGSVRVEGLESAVMVRQADDRTVELFLNYSLSITTEK